MTKQQQTPLPGATEIAALEELLRQRAEEEPGHCLGIMPWHGCKGCTMENAADMLAALASLATKVERVLKLCDERERHVVQMWNPTGPALFTADEIRAILAEENKG